MKTKNNTTKQIEVAQAVTDKLANAIINANLKTLVDSSIERISIEYHHNWSEISICFQSHTDGGLKDFTCKSVIY